MDPCRHGVHTAVCPLCMAPTDVVKITVDEASTVRNILADYATEDIKATLASMSGRWGSDVGVDLKALSREALEKKTQELAVENLHLKAKVTEMERLHKDAVDEMMKQVGRIATLQEENENLQRELAELE